RTPRRERKKYAAVRLTAAPPRPTASIARLLSLAKTTRITTARAASIRLRRASQRWAAVGHLAPGPSVKAGDGRPACEDRSVLMSCHLGRTGGRSAARRHLNRRW